MAPTRSGAGAAAADPADDVLSWLNKTKDLPGKHAAETPDEKPKRRKKSAKDVAEEPDPAVQVRGSALDMHDGETRILTLADASILDDDGEIRADDNVLEDAAKAREADLKRKKEAGKKQSLHFEEDSKRLGMLSKYDDEEEEALVSMAQDGTLDDAQVQAAIAARLKADASAMRGSGGAGMSGDAQPFPFEAAREYLQPEEQATFKKKGRRKRSRRPAADAGDDAEAAPSGQPDAVDDAGAGGNVFTQLEAAGGADLGDRGSRAAKRRRDAEEEAAAAQAAEDKRSRYELALEKANQAAELARRGPQGGSSDDMQGIGADDEDEQLQRNLLKAQQVRAAALHHGQALGDAALDSVAAAVEADKEVAGWQEEEGKLETNEAQAFIDSLSAQALPEPQPAAPPVKEEKEELDDAPPGVPDDEQGNEIDTIMADAEAEAAAAEEVAVAPPPPPPPAAASGGWEADDDEDMWAADAPLGGPAAPRIEAAGEDAVAFNAANGAAARRRMRKRSTAGAGSAEGAAAGGDGGNEESKPDGALLFELQKGLGRGLSEALLMVRERGWLGAVDYRGRISDFKHNQRTMVEDALLSDSSALSHRVGASLQRTDEFGRILTPKEAFRDVSYAFHGYKRAASKKEKNLKSLLQGRAQAGLMDEVNVPYHESRNPSQLLDDWKARKWRPKWVNYGAGAGGDKGGKKKVVKPQRDVGGAGFEGLSGITAAGSAGAGSGARKAPMRGARVAVAGRESKPAPAAAEAVKTAAALDRAQMPPPPPPA